MRKTFRIDAAELQANVKQAQKAAKRGKEICGVLLNENDRLRLLPVRNAAGRCGAFEIMPSWCRIALRANSADAGKIIGTYHSHPASLAEPGPSDVAGTWNGALILIIDCCGASAKLWRVCGDRASQLWLI